MNFYGLLLGYGVKGAFVKIADPFRLERSNDRSRGIHDIDVLPHQGHEGVDYLLRQAGSEEHAATPPSFIQAMILVFGGFV